MFSTGIRSRQPVREIPWNHHYTTGFGLAKVTAKACRIKADRQFAGSAYPSDIVDCLLEHGGFKFYSSNGKIYLNWYEGKQENIGKNMLFSGVGAATPLVTIGMAAGKLGLTTLKFFRGKENKITFWITGRKTKHTQYVFKTTVATAASMAMRIGAAVVKR